MRRPGTQEPSLDRQPVSTIQCCRLHLHLSQSNRRDATWKNERMLPASRTLVPFRWAFPHPLAASLPRRTCTFAVLEDPHMREITVNIRTSFKPLLLPR